MCHSIHRHTKTNNKYMKTYDKNEESSYMVGECLKNYQ